MPGTPQLGGVLDVRRALQIQNDLSSTTSIKSTGAVAGSGIGYGTGAGGTVTQITSKATGVTLNTLCGTITTHNAALSNGVEVGFTVTNALVGANDVPFVCMKSGGTVDSYQFTVDAVAAGSFRISISNDSAGSLSEALVLNFVVLKGSAS